MAKVCARVECGRPLITGRTFCSVRCGRLARIGTEHKKHTPQQVALFTQLWRAGASQGEITLRTGIGKNSIFSLRRRLDLIPRGSPIGKPAERPSARTVQDQARRARRQQEQAAQVPSFTERPPLPPQITPLPAPTLFPHLRSCPYPTSDGRPWQFCDTPLERGARYCAVHARLVFTPRPMRVAGAAA